MFHPHSLSSPIQLREYKIELDMSLPAPLDTVARWLLKSEGALADEEGDPQDHGRAADDAREKQELLKVSAQISPPSSFRRVQGQTEKLCCLEGRKFLLKKSNGPQIRISLPSS